MHLSEKAHKGLTVAGFGLALVAVLILIYVMYDIYVNSSGTAGKLGIAKPPVVTGPQPLGFVKGVAPAEAPAN